MTDDRWPDELVHSFAAAFEVYDPTVRAIFDWLAERGQMLPEGAREAAEAEGRRQAGLGIDWQTACVGCAEKLDERRAGHEEGYALALRDHGLDEPLEVRPEFEVRWHATDDDDGISMDNDGLPSLTEANRVGPKMVGQYGIVRWTVWQREHRAFGSRPEDWSVWIGPWRKVEQDA